MDFPFPILFTGAVTTTSVAFLLVPQFGKWHASCGSEIAVGNLRFYQIYLKIIILVYFVGIAKDRDLERERERERERESAHMRVLTKKKKRG